jgi:peptide/nickel transport system substrate-binding protein
VDEVLIGGRYRLQELIGQGGMGRVWRGIDETLGRDVAVKEVLLPQGITAEQRDVLLQRVMREARAAARLNHPGIITVHDVVEHAGAPVIVMEYVTGVSLATAIERAGGLPVARVAEIGDAVLKALGRAHAAGIVHRDLKPDNVLLMDDRVILTDFGIAHMADATMALTHTGTIIGTPAYMAPEQLVGKPPAPATDLWALGATLYCAVEGRPPFSAETFTALCIAVATEEPRPPERAGALGPVLAMLLTKDPQRRADAAQVRAGLAGVLRGAAPYLPPGAPVVPTQIDRGAPPAPTPAPTRAPTPAPHWAPGAAPGSAPGPVAAPGPAPAHAPGPGSGPGSAPGSGPASGPVGPRRARAGEAPYPSAPPGFGPAMPDAMTRDAAAPPVPPSRGPQPSRTGMRPDQARWLRLAGCFVLAAAICYLLPWNMRTFTPLSLLAVLATACLNAFPRPRLRPAVVWGCALLLDLALMVALGLMKTAFGGTAIASLFNALLLSTGAWLLWRNIPVRDQ